MALFGGEILLVTVARAVRACGHKAKIVYLHPAAFDRIMKADPRGQQTKVALADEFEIGFLCLHCFVKMFEASMK